TGIPHDRIARAIYDDEPFESVQLLGSVLARAELDRTAAGGRGLVHTCVSRADRARHGLPLDALERVIDVLRCTTEAEVAVVLKQADDGRWKVSMRSKGAVDVSAVALRLGGGGHRFAAGFDGGQDAGAVLTALREVLADPAAGG
ncbi:MAG TPA: DHHA1 domain-containing protein, partial [Candidatus Nanopelagicales bacterium]|nr:DHHA1 domain-containing protein [Candidatus Nanopelagicales bacterium]